MKLCILTAIAEEYAAVCSYLEDTSEFTSGSLMITKGRLKKFASLPDMPEIEVFVPAPTSAGNIQSAMHTGQIANLQPDLVAMVGCAGGLPGKANLYDVIFADRVAYYEPGKDNPAGFAVRPDQHKPPLLLISTARIEATRPDWKALSTEKVSKSVCARVEPIAAGEAVLANPESPILAHVKSAAGRAVAVEMEGFGVMEAAYQLGLDAIVVRGISDLLDKPDAPKKKSKTVAHLNKYQVKATKNAMAFLIQVLAKSKIAKNYMTGTPLSSLTLHINAQESKFGHVLATLSERAGDLPFQDIHINLGSVYITCLADPVFAGFMDESWRAGILDKYLGFEVSYCAAGEGSEIGRTLAQQLASIPRYLVGTPLSREFRILSTLNGLGDKYRAFKEGVMNYADTVSENRVTIGTSPSASAVRYRSLLPELWSVSPEFENLTPMNLSHLTEIVAPYSLQEDHDDRNLVSVGFGIITFINLFNESSKYLVSPEDWLEVVLVYFLHKYTGRAIYEKSTPRLFRAGENYGVDFLLTTQMFEALNSIREEVGFASVAQVIGSIIEFMLSPESPTETEPTQS